jgi:hypothetical protein
MAEEPSGEELIDESGRNPTQREIDEGGPSQAPVDAPWDENVAPEPARDPDAGNGEWETEATPHEGEEGTEPV